MPELPTFSPRPHRVFSAGFYPSTDFDYEVRCVLGGAPSGTSDVGEVLATIDNVANNDHEHWFNAWHETGSRVRTAADVAAAAGHRHSASQSYLRAATYFAVALNSVSGLTSDELLVPTFRLHRSSWDGFVDTTDRIVERVKIPYEQGILPGWFFTPGADGRARPTLVMVNGSDGAISSLWGSGAAGALARGYNVLLFDGPGQQSMLFERGIGFRPDWEAVLTPVADFILQRPDVDNERLALYGISQGGYWIARALAYEHRFAAAIADPGVTDVAASWNSNIPSPLMKVFRAGKKVAFDRDMALGMKFSPQTSRTWNFRARPYMQGSYFDTLTEVHRYTLTDDEAAQITTPLLITDPEDEQFWPRQSADLADRAGGPTELSHFTAAEGANFHCQPMARLLTDERMFDWLDTILSS
ncbi:prolyl oligopeptidase family serine peptidase [Rhodococcus sp. (in: high G+C Gram-positive bacteria)]|uniref:alpha/beta hydrolase family protein n=1 Tax=Rhodococcus sp. TaxID=1831 RepID=UPI00257A4B2F|nr:prolyl oligopeptidase family serine peptidase [Rhodococcus sp. (in: high G+C Gram-positive bacteria)]MBQ7806416.1 alpha/beta fold hydrolase [Rhodococcus sp. (in: high G+C Gram-positive bacteria)]